MHKAVIPVGVGISSLSIFTSDGYYAFNWWRWGVYGVSCGKSSYIAIIRYSQPSVSITLLKPKGCIAFDASLFCDCGERSVAMPSILACRFISCLREPGVCIRAIFHRNITNINSEMAISYLGLRSCENHVSRNLLIG